jgi:hypothetical protein
MWNRHMESWGADLSEQKEWQVQRPWGEHVPVILKEQQGDHWVIWKKARVSPPVSFVLSPMTFEILRGSLTFSSSFETPWSNQYDVLQTMSSRLILSYVAPRIFWAKREVMASWEDCPMRSLYSPGVAREAVRLPSAEQAFYPAGCIKMLVDIWWLAFSLLYQLKVQSFRACFVPLEPS